MLVTELSRFSRSTKDFTILQEYLEEHDCKFLSIRENFDTSGAAGQMVLTMMASIAEFERRQTGERVASSFLARSKRGLHNGGSVPLGYRIDDERPGHFVVVPDEAKVVQSIFKTFIQEGSLAATAKHLNAQNIRFPRMVRGGGGARGDKLSLDMIYRIMRNRAYIAVRVYSSKAGSGEAQAVWEPIIDQETFDRVNKILTENRSRRKTHGPNKFPFLLSGLVFCSQCAGRMGGASATSRSGHRVGYYEHAVARKKEACISDRLLNHGPRRVPSAKLEPIVWQEVKKFLQQDEFLAKILNQARKSASSVPSDAEIVNVRAKKATLERQIAVLAERIGLMPESVDPLPLYKQLGDFQNAQQSLSAEIEKLESVVETDSSLTATLQSLDKFSKLVRAAIKKTMPIPK